MRYRQLSPTGDYMFGSGQKNFLINSPQTVGQVVETSLRLWLGEWYLNINEGTPYPEGVLGKHSQAEADLTILSQIRQCQGVVNIENYTSVINPETRVYQSASGLLNTIYGPTQLQISNYGNF